MIMILPCNYDLYTIVFPVGGLRLIPYRQYSIGHVLYSEHYKFPIYIITDVTFLYLCLCLLCTVVCMLNVHTAYIFIVCNSVISTKYLNIFPMFCNSHIAINYIGHFVYSPLNSYFIYIGYWTLHKYILVLVILLLCYKYNLNLQFWATEN